MRGDYYRVFHSATLRCAVTRRDVLGTRCIDSTDPPWRYPFLSHRSSGKVRSELGGHYAAGATVVRELDDAGEFSAARESADDLHAQAGDSG